MQTTTRGSKSLLLTCHSIRRRKNSLLGSGKDLLIYSSHSNQSSDVIAFANVHTDIYALRLITFPWLTNQVHFLLFYSHKLFTHFIFLKKKYIYIYMYRYRYINIFSPFVSLLIPFSYHNSHSLRISSMSMLSSTSTPDAPLFVTGTGNTREVAQAIFTEPF